MRSFVERPVVYLAGPYTNPNPVHNTSKTIKAANRLHATQKVTCWVPHMNLLWDIVEPHEEDYWYDYDLSQLARCDYLLRLPGESPGADREVEFAHERGIMVFFSEEMLFSYLDRTGQ